MSEFRNARRPGVSSWWLALPLLFALLLPAPALAGPCRPAVPIPAATQPPNLGVLKLQLLDYKCFGQYDRDVAAVLAEARAYVEQRAAVVTNPALVLDIDETSLSNWTEIETNDFGFIIEGKCDLKPNFPCGSNDWELNHFADVIAPTLALFNAAKAKGVAIFFVSARPEGHREATINNLRAAGYDGWTDLVMRTGHFTLIASYKAPERAKIAAKGFTIVANVGDQQSDLDGGFAERTFKVPNPFYLVP
jgi:predicted secreted acid phosphatase